MKKEISEKDLGRKYWFNQVWQGVAMLFIIVGTRQWDLNGKYNGIFVIFMGIVMLILQLDFIWKLKSLENKK